MYELNEINNQSGLKKCPFCGCDIFYSKDYVKGTTVTYYRYDGKETDNGQMYEHLSHNTGKFAYCADCDKRLFDLTTGELSKNPQSIIDKIKPN